MFFNLKICIVIFEIETLWAKHSTIKRKEIINILRLLLNLLECMLK